MKSGYTVDIAAEAGSAVVTVAAKTCNASANDAVSSYWGAATPVTVGSTGQRSFATDSRGTLFQDQTGAAFANPIPAGSSPVQCPPSANRPGTGRLAPRLSLAGRARLVGERDGEPVRDCGVPPRCKIP